MEIEQKKPSTSLLGSIFGGSKKGSTNDGSDNSTKEGGDGLSDLFTSVSSKLPQRPNIVDPHAFVKKSVVPQDPDGKESKIVKGGKKRMREKNRKTEAVEMQAQRREDNEGVRQKKKKKHPPTAGVDTTTGDKEPLVSKSSVPHDSTDDAVTEKATTTEVTPDDDDDHSSSKKGQAEDRTIFVGNLPLDITRKGLASLFKHCGKIESTRLRSVAASGVKLPTQKKGNQSLVKKVCANTKQVDDTSKKTAQGYVVFDQVASVAAALSLNNKAAVPNSDLQLRVDRAAPTMDSARSVFVGNLPYGAEESELRTHFEDACGNDTVEGVRVVRHPDTMQCKGFGYVLLHDKEHVAEALRLHDSRFMNRTIRVQVCGKRYKGKRGEVNKADAANKPKGFEGLRPTEAAAKRLMAKMNASKKQMGGGASSKIKLVPNEKKRKTYSERNAAVNKPGKKNTTGVSKRAASESRVNKRVKKLQKRVDKGMGKTKNR